MPSRQVQCRGIFHLFRYGDYTNTICIQDTQLYDAIDINNVAYIARIKIL